MAREPAGAAAAYAVDPVQPFTEGEEAKIVEGLEGREGARYSVPHALRGLAAGLVAPPHGPDRHRQVGLPVLTWGHVIGEDPREYAPPEVRAAFRAYVRCAKDDVELYRKAQRDLRAPKRSIPDRELLEVMSTALPEGHPLRARAAAAQHQPQEISPLVVREVMQGVRDWLQRAERMNWWDRFKLQQVPQDSIYYAVYHGHVGEAEARAAVVLEDPRALP